MWIDTILERIGNCHDPIHTVRQSAALFKKVQRDERSVCTIAARYMDAPPSEIFKAFEEPKQLAANVLVKSIRAAEGVGGINHNVEIVNAIINSSAAEIPRGYVEEEFEVPRKIRRRS